MNDIRKLLIADITPARASVLKGQAIDPLQPGPLLTNIARLIEAIGTGVPTTSSIFALPQSLLAELNESMVEPLPHDLKRPQLRSFPTLMGLFLLLRSTGLAIGVVKPKRTVLIDPAMLDQWLVLNPTEQYFTLMASWLYDATWESVGQGSRMGSRMFYEMRNTYLILDDRITTLGPVRFGEMYGIEKWVSMELLHQFGWIRMTYDTKSQPGKAANLREIHRTDFGDAMFVAMHGLDTLDKEKTKALQANMKKYFPNWKGTLTQPTAEYRDGRYTFKVSLGETWRRIVASANVGLEQLADAVLAAYNFDNEHMYQFELRDPKGNGIQIVGPNIKDAEYFADEFRVGDVPLVVGDSMILHYDFRDDWLFKVNLESVDEIDGRKAKSIKVTEKSGSAPKQYDHDLW